MEEPAVKVTLADIYAEVVKTGREVTELKHAVATVLKTTDKHSERIRELELTTITKKGAYALTTVVGILAAVGGFFLNLGNRLWT